jgi:hypothetical protein
MTGDDLLVFVGFGIVVPIIILWGIAHCFWGRHT